MPWQLKRGLQQRVKGAPPRPIVENLDAIPVHKLPIPLLSDAKTYIIPNISLTFPWICGCKVARDKVEFTRKPLGRNRLGETQTFHIKHIKTGFGVRHAFVCDCGGAVIKLYHLHGRLACKHCHRAISASQALGRTTRPALQAMRLESFLAKPRLSRKTREHLTKRLGQKLTMAQGKYSTQAARLWE